MSGTTPSSHRYRLTQLSDVYWKTSASTGQHGAELPIIPLPDKDFVISPAADLDTHVQSALSVSDHSTCVGCGLTFLSFREQRLHFASDFHKYNARRRVRGRPPLNADEFEAMERHDTASVDSISASEEDLSTDAEDEVPPPENGNNAGHSSNKRNGVKLEFPDPARTGHFVSLYKAALPDEQTLSSLAVRGGWAVIMSGGGHFAAAVWDKQGAMTHHKTFHRYTSRQKQGGSQALADSSGGKRIRSAGATLRRYGEQRLQEEVRSLLVTWSTALKSVQCAFIRAGVRERRDLLIGWEESPLADLAKKDGVRNIPFPTRRPTLKEVGRVFDELMTVIVSPTSSIPVAVPQGEDAGHVANSESAQAVDAGFRAASATADKCVQSAGAPVGPASKGTAHLKKRNDSRQKGKEDVQEKDQAESGGGVGSGTATTIDAKTMALLRACVDGDVDALGGLLVDEDVDGHGGLLVNEVEVSGRSSEGLIPRAGVFPKTIAFDIETVGHVFGDVECMLSGKVGVLQEDWRLGLVGVACVAGNVLSLRWLLDHGVSPCVGVSPYMWTKSKAARTALRRYWHERPDAYDYSGAGIPSALTDEDVAREAARRRRERERRREKKKQQQEGEEREEEEEEAEDKSEELRMLDGRELRAMAAESRMLGNRCAQCRKSLAGLVGFERLCYKYCGMECVSKHRVALAKMSGAAIGRG